MKYSKMMEVNESINRQKRAVAKAAIEGLQNAGEKITISKLVKLTGLSRGYFYKNQEIRAGLEDIIKNQNAQRFSGEAVREKISGGKLQDMILKNEELEAQNKELVERNERLVWENEKLKRRLGQKEITVLNKI